MRKPGAPMGPFSITFVWNIIKNKTKDNFGFLGSSMFYFFQSTNLYVFSDWVKILLLLMNIKISR